jgi:hypothetical protein
MALSAATLKAALGPTIKAKIEAVFTIDDASKLTPFATALADAIATEVVAHIVANAVVSGTVTSGPGAGGNIAGQVT